MTQRTSGHDDVSRPRVYLGTRVRARTPAKPRAPGLRARAATPLVALAWLVLSALCAPAERAAQRPDPAAPGGTASAVARTDGDAAPGVASGDPSVEISAAAPTDGAGRTGTETGTAATPEQVATRGPVTNLPLPRFVSLKSDKGNARRGPALSHRIDWVYKRRAMPLEVTAEFGHWRRVRDREGAGGWVHYALISGVRTVLVLDDMVAMRQQPAADARVLARAEAGVVARLGACTPDWCRLSAGGQRGWVRKSALWGVAPDELRD